MFVNQAFAQTANAAAPSAGEGMLMNFLPLILIFVVFYFMLIRPQQKKLVEHQKVLSSIKRGDKVLTSGGIIATVSKVVSDDEITIEIADGVKVRLRRSAIEAVLSPSEPSANENAPA